MYIRYPYFIPLLPFYDKRISKASNVSLDNNNANLVLDSQNDYDIPKHFRKSTDIINTQSNKNINISGLNTLNISGSQQFSQYNLPLIINSIGPSFKIIVLDLRQESHGFINGSPISWANALNDANKGLTFKQVMIDEYTKLKSIKLNVPITFYNHKNMTIVPKKVEDENHLVHANSLSYIRIPVTDGKIPTDDMVDYFVLLVKSQPKNTWLHFHCKQGIGRTTTFMIMYDMMKNSKQVSADDIINRQLLLASFDESHIKSFNNNERIMFLQNFYEYCQEYSDDFY
ncbi:MAG: protein-tyrosine phosphatase [Clostridium sp.]|jgi:protein-tyrosine phosphatase